MTALDALIVLAFIAYSVAQGLRARRVSGQSLEEYFLAGRRLPGWKAGVSMAATQFAADTPLVVTGLIATAGVFSLWRFWIYALSFLLLGFVLAPSWRRVGVLTDAELTEVRYGERPALLLRGIKAIYFGTIFNCVVLAMVLLAATRIAEPFLHWHVWLPAVIYDPAAVVVESLGVPLTLVPQDPSLWPADVWIRSTNNLLSILAIVGVTAFYSTTGGLRSVVNTDVVQFAIMMGGTALFVWIVVTRVGGLSTIPHKLEALFAMGNLNGMSSPEQLLAFTPTEAKDLSLGFLAVLGLQWIAQMNADGTGYLAQRTMACRSDRDARQAAVVFTVTQILIRSLLWLPMGLALLLLFAPDPQLPSELFKAEREFTFVRGIDELLPAGIKGIMLTGMFAALASTVDTHLNWGSSYWANDLYKRFVCECVLRKEPSPRSLVWVARSSNWVILSISLVVMMHLTSIQQAWESSLLLGAGMGGMLVLRWLWWRVTAVGELSAILASLFLLPILLLGVSSYELQFLSMFGVSTGVGVLVSLSFGPEKREQLVEFYRRARPPGFWGPVAREAGLEDKGMAVLGRALVAVILAAFSIFCLLTGIGSWLVGSPTPTWWLWGRAQWIVVLLVMGIGLVPLWWRLAFVRREDGWVAGETEVAPCGSSPHNGKPR